MKRAQPYKILPTVLKLEGLDIVPEAAAGEEVRSHHVHLGDFLEFEAPGSVLIISVETEDGRLLEKRRVPLELLDKFHALKREHPDLSDPDAQ